MNEYEETTAAARDLAAVPFFSALTPVDRAKLAGVLEDRWIDAGTVVFESGGAGDALYVLREGTAERRVSGTAIGLIHPPSVFGELALLTDEPRSASIVAVTPIRVWVLPRHRFDSLLRGEPDLMLHLGTAIGLELAKARRALGELQRELDEWLAERLSALTPEESELIEAAALFDCPPLAVLARLMAAPTAAVPQELRALDRLTPLLHECQSSYAVPPAIRRAILRGLEAQHRKGAVAARLREVAQELEREGGAAGAAAAYLAAGAEADASRVLVTLPPEERRAIAASVGEDTERADTTREKTPARGSERGWPTPVRLEEARGDRDRARTVFLLDGNAARRLVAGRLAGAAHHRIGRDSFCVRSAARSGRCARPTRRVGGRRHHRAASCAGRLCDAGVDPRARRSCRGCGRRQHRPALSRRADGARAQARRFRLALLDARAGRNRRNANAP